MKKIICLLLTFAVIFSLWGCVGISLDTAEVETVPASTEPVWMPYDGESKNYVYYYDSGLNRMWEEDLLYVAQLYLDNHALLTSEECLVSYRVGTAFDGYYTDEMYNPELREAFIAEVNALIPNLEEMSKGEFLFSLQKILAILGDAHAYLKFSGEEYFDISVKEEEGAFYALMLPQKHSELLYCELTAINDIPLTEVIDLLRPYIPHENEQWLLHELASPQHYGDLFCADLLRLVGVMNKKDKTAEFTFRTEDGEQKVELEAKEPYEMVFDKIAGDVFYDSPLYRNDEQNYWYEFMGDALYFRISEFHDQTGYTMLQAGNEMLAAAKKQEDLDKLIVDVRQNGGGYRLQGYNELINVLKRIKVDKVYVLMDSGSFSQSVIFTTIIKQDLENAVLVGTPAGQAPNFFGGVESYKTSNTEIEFVLPNRWMSMWEGYEYEALMPDVVVEQSLQDYKDNVDAALNYVLAQ